MGMAASQARLLSLQARKSNLEYHGQQINQERTILSQQCTSLYNSLLAMQVPTPPSTSDYTTVQYSGTLGATNYTFDATTVKPSPTNKGAYIITVNQQAYGDSLQKNASIAVVKTGAEAGTITAKEVASKTEDDKPVTVTEKEIANLYVLENGALRKATKADFTGTQEPYTLKTDVKYYQQAQTGDQFHVANTIDGISVDGHPVSEIRKADITEEQKSVYEAAIRNSGITKPDGTPYEPTDFYIYFNDKGNTCFALKSDVDDGNTNAVTYSYVSNGQYNQPVTYDNALLTFDPANGRITEISLPNYATTEVDGKIIYDYTQPPVSYTTIKVQANTITDEHAYQDAYAQYEYDQYEYDRTQQEINAKTEIIQQEDRNLELKLERLDAERQTIEAETEALEKVIQDNISDSYKTFSG